MEVPEINTGVDPTLVGNPQTTTHLLPLLIDTCYENAKRLEEVEERLDGCEQALGECLLIFQRIDEAIGMIVDKIQEWVDAEEDSDATD
jgi:hypothetical protein